MMSYDRAQGLAIQVGQQLSTFDPHAFMANAASWQHEQILVVARDLSLVNPTVGMRTGRTAAQLSTWASDSQVHGLLPLALTPVGSNKIVISVAARFSSSEPMLSWDSITVGMGSAWNVSNTTALPQNSFTVGSDLITLLGRNMGSHSYSPSARLHGGVRSAAAAATACEVTMWRSECSLLCRTAHGLHASLRISATAGRAINSVTQAFTFNLPSVEVGARNHSSGATNAPARWHVSSTNVTVLRARSMLEGANFGAVSYTGKARVGFSSCEVSRWNSDSGIICNWARGVGSSATALMTVGERRHSAHEAVSYDVPQLQALHLQAAMSSYESLGTEEGSTEMSAMTSDAPSLSWGSCDTYDVGGVNQGWCRRDSVCEYCISNCLQECREVTPTVDELMASVSLPLHLHDGGNGSGWEYGKQRNTVWRPLGMQANNPATGGLSITLNGHTLGVASYSRSVRVGATAIEGTIWTSDSNVAGRAAAGLGRTLVVLITAGQQARGSSSETYSLDTPRAMLFPNLVYASQPKGSFTPGLPPISASSSNSAGLGQLVMNNMSSSATFGLYTPRFVHMVGAGFGHFAASVIARTGQTQSEASLWMSDTQALTLKPHGVAGSVHVIVSASGLLESRYEMLSYDRAVMRLHRGGSAGFGEDGWEVDPEYDNSTDFPEGYHYKWFDGPSGFRVEKIAGEAVLIMNSPATGAMVLVLKAAQLSKHDYTPSVRLGFSAGEITVWTSDTLCPVQTPAGETMLTQMAVTLARQVSTLSTAMTYDDVRGVSAARRSNAMATGSVLLTLHGSNFGSAGRTTVLRLQSSVAESTSWESETSIGLRLAASARGTRRVVLTSGMLRRGSLTQSISLDVGFLSLVRRSNKASTGSASLTVSGN